MHIAAENRLGMDCEAWSVRSIARRQERMRARAASAGRLQDGRGHQSGGRRSYKGARAAARPGAPLPPLGMHGVVLNCSANAQLFEGVTELCCGTVELFSMPLGLTSHAEHDDEHARVRLQGTKIMATTDPDGWKVVFVDNEDFLAELK
jgi:hypothetical protein